MTTRRPSRSAFTLLEVVLAMAIGVLLLAGLYLTLSTTLHQQRVGRSAVQQSVLARSLLGRIERDISAHLPPVDPSLTAGGKSGGGKSGGGASGGSGGSGGTSAGGSGTSVGGSSASGGSSMASGSGSSGSGSGSSSSSSNSSSSGGTSSSVVFNLGVQGDATHLVLFVSQLPSEAYQSTDQNPPLVSDLRLVTYWLVGSSGGNGAGLARAELKVATSDDVQTFLQNVTGGSFDMSGVDGYKNVLSEDVTDLSFQYFDGQNWQDSWDGTQLQSDNKTQMGPPAAVAINLTVRRPGTTNQTQTYRHVVAIPTANNFISTSQSSSQSGSTPSTGGTGQ
jgi:prepilin-type N-terminal cleavage/methylation domain-containing protein